MNTTLRVVAAFALAAPFASVSLADASAPPPPPPADRGLLSGPDVDKDASQGRRQFGPGDARMRDGDREGQQGRRGAGAMRRFAMLATAVRDAEPTPEQAAAVRTYLGEVRLKAQTFAKEHGEEMRKLVRVRRELVADGGDLREVDAEILALRTSFMKPGEILRNVQDRLGPEQRERFRESLQRQIRAAMERTRMQRRGEMGAEGGMPAEPRRRGGRPEGPAMDGADGPRGRGAMGGPAFGGSIEEVFEAELLLEAMRGSLRGEGDRGRGDRPGAPSTDRPRLGENRPPLDLDTPPNED